MSIRDQQAKVDALNELRDAMQNASIFDVVQSREVQDEELRAAYAEAQARAEAGDDAAAALAGELLVKRHAQKEANRILFDAIDAVHRQAAEAKAKAEAEQAKQERAEIHALTAAWDALARKCDYHAKLLGKNIELAADIVERLKLFGHVTHVHPEQIDPRHAVADALNAAGSRRLMKAVEPNAVRSISMTEQLHELFHHFPILDPRTSDTTDTDTDSQ